MKIEAKDVVKYGAMLLVLVVWGVRLEGRVDKSLGQGGRIERLETSIGPLIVHHEVVKIMDKMGTVTSRRKHAEGYAAAVAEARLRAAEQIRLPSGLRN